jgi:trehalose 6-phosphate phosphatase
VSTAATALADAIAPLIAEPARAAVLLDVDGTLAPIVRHAEDAHVPEPTRTPLIAIAKRYGFVACVSGRRAATARRIVSLGSITYLGNHGTEVLVGGSTHVEVDPELESWTEQIRGFAEGELARRELQRARIRGEDKESIAAFHWRGAPDEDAAEQIVRQLAQRAEEAGFTVHWGRKILEVRPPVEISKGRGVERLLSGRGLAQALYAGDDVTDCDAFEGLRRLVSNGELGACVCVGVSSDETPQQLIDAADAMVDGTAGVRRMLEALAAS